MTLTKKLPEFKIFFVKVMHFIKFKNNVNLFLMYKRILKTFNIF